MSDCVSIRVLIVKGDANQPIWKALTTLVENEYKVDNVEVIIDVLPEQKMHEVLLHEASTGGTTYDIYLIGPFDAQVWARNGWLENLEPYFDDLSLEKKDWYDRKDVIRGMVESLSVDGYAYGLPFYGESSFVMYNKELFNEKGLSMPENPTWDQLYVLAKQIHDPKQGIVGMAMRGAPGWGMSGAPFVTMINAFGGRFYDLDWNATIDTLQQREAWKMFKKIMRDVGPSDPARCTYNECIELMTLGKCGMYYDATSIAASLEAEASLVKGKVGYVSAPHQIKKNNTAWLWNWAMAINAKSTEDKKKAAFEFILWATSKDYIAKSMEYDPTGTSTPPASRSSTYQQPVYAATPYASATLKTLEELDFNKPTVDPVPYVGLQYMATPGFPAAATSMTELLAEYMVDAITLDEAISKTQKVFTQAAMNDRNYIKT